MGLAVLHPGLFSTVQDLGRVGYRAFGVPSGGVFDRGSAGLANALLGNSADAAVIELTLFSGRFEARSPLALALAGAPVVARRVAVDGRATVLDAPCAFAMGSSERLDVEGVRLGARAYLAVLGGWQTPVVLGSRSSETPLRAGDVLPCTTGWTPSRHVDPDDDPFASGAWTPLRVIDGPDAGRLVRDPFVGVQGGAVVLSESNRMGLRLDGPTCEVVEDPGRVSAPVAPGAVQVAGGQLLVLGAACGTMGGYPHVAHVIAADLDRLAQARPGDRLWFARVGLDDARRADRERRADLARRLDRIRTAARDVLRGPAYAGDALD